MNKQNFLTRMLLLLALIVGSVNGAWADDVTIATATFDGKNATYTEGWSTTGTGKGRTDCIIIGKGENITSPSFNLSIYSNVTITFTGRRYGTLTGSKATVAASISGNSVGNSLDITASSVGAVSGSISFVPTEAMTSAYLVFTCTNATSAGSSHGAGIGSITIKGTLKAKSDPTITFNDGSVRVGKSLDLSTLFSSDSEGDVTYTITAGDTYASIVGSTLTGVAEGSVTVKVSQDENATHNSGEKSATITVNPALTLSSIVITTTPDKITYNEGEPFDATGMVVTATYTDESTDDVTALATWTPSGALSTSDTEITVSYTENGTTKSAKQPITVNAYVQPKIVNLTLNNAFFGTSYTGADAKGSGNHTGSQDGITVNFKSGGNKNNFYISDSEIRAYSGNTLEFVAPTGYVITKIVFTKAWATGTTIDGGSLNAERKIWTNATGSSSVDFTPSSRSDITTLTVYIAEPVAISAAGYATYVSVNDLDYTDLAVKAYKASVSGTTITFTKVTTVPAGQGVLLQGAEGTYNVPVTTGVAAWGDNAFVRGKGAYVATESDGKYNYILNDGSNGVGFYKANGQMVATNRAYLQSTSNAARLSFSFDDEAGEATGISEVKDVKADTAVYNLNGVRVKNMTKGLYIMNGKKVIVK